MIRSIEEQIAAMADRWPQLKVTEREERSAVWEGVLAPDKREHLVRIAYRVPFAVENVNALLAQPRVRVLKPELELHPDYEQGPLPHVYWGTKSRNVPYLCLFDPSAGEWGIDDLLADTTVFWAAEWLYFYEGWLVTKKWRGGGHNPVANDNGGQKQLEAV